MRTNKENLCKIKWYERPFNIPENVKIVTTGLNSNKSNNPNTKTIKTLIEP
jgi:hypothetical protein